MEIQEYQKLWDLEHIHWWHVGMRNMSLSWVNRFYDNTTRRPLILDAGCGTGGMLRQLGKYGQNIGVDISETAIDFCRGGGSGLVCQASISELPFKDASFDLVTSFDVIYHLAVKDDVVALKEFSRVLKDGGKLLIRVPTYDFLRSNRDLATHTRHRYTARELKGKLAEARFIVRRITYVNFVLFPLAAIVRIWERFTGLSGKRDDMPLPPVLVNKMLLAVLTFENYLLRRVSFPFGLSLMCLAKKVKADRLSPTTIHG